MTGDTVITVVEYVVVALFPLSEIILAIMRRSSIRVAQNPDRGSLRLLWITVSLAVTLAVLAQWIPPGRMGGSEHAHGILALLFLTGGLTLRWAAICTLGRFFTVDVAIHERHAVVQSGPYRFIRHPSYTGLLLAFLGLGVSFSNWLSMLVLMTPITFAVLNRVKKEEHALAAALGHEYIDYCGRTKRFIPGLL